jgi:hypothetical protein
MTAHIDIYRAANILVKEYGAGPSCAYFDLQHAWKHDLRSKFEKRLADAASRYADEND